MHDNEWYTQEYIAKEKSEMHKLFGSPLFIYSKLFSTFSVFCCRKISGTKVKFNR